MTFSSFDFAGMSGCCSVVMFLRIVVYVISHLFVLLESLPCCAAWSSFAFIRGEVCAGIDRVEHARGHLNAHSDCPCGLRVFSSSSWCH